mgnify:CR=1 FL=1
MHALAAGETVCPECGRPYGSVKAESFALKPGTILDGKYLVGEMLGQGGFGITYIGFDLLLEQKIAIKEYFPMSTGMVSREGRSTVVWSDAVMQKSGVEKGFDSFLKEARKMAKLRSIPSVVGVNSVFIQNETAYIVMDFIEGETLLKKLQREDPMDYGTCVSLMAPIMQALSEVHKHGIIHRDISPDNIMVQNDGRLILLDLGAAKDLDIQGKDGNMQSSQMVAKHGFSPVEQYGQAGKIGPWTDVYAMAATIYYCCTGTLPPTSVDRIVEDTLTCKPRLTKEQFDVLAAGMSILPQKRPQDMAALLQIVTRLQKGGKAEPVKPAPQAEPAKAQQTPPVPPRPADVKPPVKNAPPKTPQKKPLPAWLIPAVAGIVAVLGIVVCIVTATGKAPRQNVSMKAAATEPVLQPAPAETTPKATTPKATVPKATEPKPEPTTKPTQPKNYIENVDGYWESTNLKDGNFSLNVHALVFYTPLVRCREMTVNMEVSMNAGTKCKEWQVWGRVNGQFQKIAKISLPAGDGAGSETIKFDTPLTFDAIIVTPTVIGGYSWSMGLSVTDAWLAD